VENDSNDSLQIEVYPPPEETEILHYTYRALPTTLSIASTIPPQIDAHILKEGALIDLFRKKMSEALDKGAVEVAAVWRNEYRAQETKWKTYIQDAKRTDRGVDDATFIIQSIYGPQDQGEIRNARDYVFNKWGWPSYL
jgi:hypothetical protein